MERSLSTVNTSFNEHNWRGAAACRDVGPDVFFPDKGRSPKDAKAYCAACAVRLLCLEAALAVPAGDDHGVWGGTTVRERRAERAKRRYQDHADEPVEAAS